MVMIMIIMIVASDQVVICHWSHLRDSLRQLLIDDHHVRREPVENASWHQVMGDGGWGVRDEVKRSVSDADIGMFSNVSHT